MSTLAVYSLSDSFSALWPGLAAECGFEHLAVEDPVLAPLDGDIVLVSAGGMEERLEPLVRRLAGSAAEVVAVGADANHRLAAALARAGAAEYFVLPQDEDALRSWLRERAARLKSLVDRAAFAESERAKYRFDEIRGDSVALRAALDRAAKVIPHAGVTVLITGETGTGKELIARAIHYNGPRRQAPFVEVNCAAIPDQLLESELFGHEKGAFTGAVASKPGLFEVANGGTIFLDEIGHLPLGLQGKLLRVLEERTVRRVGGTRPVVLDVRVIAATHVDLKARARTGEFREDLYYRLDVVSIELPSLRARREDIAPLARHFLSQFAAQYGMAVPRVDERAMTALESREWRGNVRELRNVLERALILARGAVLGPDDFPDRPALALSQDSPLPFPATLGEIARAAAAAMLAQCGGNKSETARRLGISRARLMRLLDANPDPDPDDNDPEDSDA
jgi:DNA-binding NtrC family response regulator